jgi:hypothetical protein
MQACSPTILIRFAQALAAKYALPFQVMNQVVQESGVTREGEVEGWAGDMYFCCDLVDWHIQAEGPEVGTVS